VICAPCGHENAANRRFCGGCGAHLFSVCTHCAFQNDATDRFCGGCGDALPAERVLAARPARPTTPAVPVAVRSVAAVPAMAHAAPAVASVHAPAPMLAVAPPPLPVPPPLPIKGRAEDLLSSSELSDLLRRPAAPAVVASEGTDLPEGAITQESLDALFGG
jgi:hypothetical protein